MQLTVGRLDPLLVGWHVFFDDAAALRAARVAPADEDVAYRPL